MERKSKNHVNVNHARSKDQAKALVKIVEGKFCPFCDPNYLKKEHKKPILAENEHWLATENRWPYEGASAHLLFIHKQHIEHVSEVSEAAWKDLQEITVAMTKKMKLTGATLVMRFGESKFTGATVTHLHAQLISGKGKKGGKEVLARVG